MRIRLLPFMIFFSLATMLAKLGDVLQGHRYFSNALLITHLQAKPSSPTIADPPDKSAKGVNPKDKAPESDPAKVTDEAPPPIQLPDCTPLTKPEIELLQQLSDRRQKLDQREADITSQENVLTVTQNKIDERLAELKSLQNDVASLLNEYNSKEDAKIASLVKIYESMKPKEAATIFEELEMPILLQVIGHMKEAKAALIIAQMTPNRATLLTTALAEQKKLAQPADCCG